MSDHEAAWRRLRAAGAAAAARPITGLFDAEPDRLSRMSLEACGLYLDLSKQPWSTKDLGLALDLARAADIEVARDRLFAGQMVNPSEGRAALHMALRAPAGAAFAALGEPVSAEVEAMGVTVLEQFATLGQWDFINILEAPDELTMAKVATTLASRGTLKTMTLPIMEIDAFIDRLKQS